MSLDVQALQDSFASIAEREHALATRFYEIFFERYPEVRPMFGRTNTTAQAKMLTSALAAVVAHAEDGEWLVSTLHGLGANHVKYGVTDEMYAWVGECLIMALGEEPSMNPRALAAWGDAFGAVSTLMKEGAASVDVPTKRSASAA